MRSRPRHPTPRALLLAALVMLCGATARSAAADEARDQANLNHVAGILVIQVSTTDEARERELRFVEELSLVLDEMPVRLVVPRSADFVDLPMREQVAEVRKLLKAHGAVAATWLDTSSPDLLLLHLVAVSTGRALVRLVESTADAGSEARLALAARELLGTAFLLEELPDREGSPIGRAADAVLEKATAAAGDNIEPAAPLSAEGAEADPRWSVVLETRFSGGAVGHTGPVTRADLALGLDRRLTNRLFGRVWLAGFVGPLDSTERAEILFWGLAPGLGAAFLWKIDSIAVGPAVGVDLSWTNIAIDLDSGHRFTYRDLKARAIIRLEVLLRLTDKLALAAAAGIVVSPWREAYERVSDDAVVLAMPYLAWTGSLGVRFGVR